MSKTDLEQPGGDGALLERGGQDPLAAVDEPLFLELVDAGGTVHRLEALEGWRLMEIIRDWGHPIQSECGGSCVCGKCLVHIDEAYFARLPQPHADELARLDESPKARANSRLACQVLMTPDVNGVRLRLA
jgi:2Fe-2S ferredoxin